MREEELGREARNEVFVVAAIVAVCLAIFGQVVRFQFINHDDDLYVYQNSFVLAGINWESVKWAFTTFHSANWHPVTWLSHMLDASIFGSSPGGHHLVNVIFHVANSVLGFFVFRRLTGDFWKSAIVAFLFAVHPAHVESVAWIAERKDVLSTAFWLLTLWLYAKHAEADSPDGPNYFSRPMFLALVTFALGLMTKPMLVTLPFVLLLLDYWPLGRLKAKRDLPPLIVEKLPFFVLSIASAFVTLIAQRAGGAMQSLEVIPLDTRALNAIVSYAKYVVMLVWPFNLGVGYAYTYPIPLWQIAGAIVLLAGISALAIRQRRQRPYLIVGWLWFLGTLVPVIGLVQVGAQSMADRYTYVPYFGLFVIVVWASSEFFQKVKLGFSGPAAAAAVAISLLGIMAFNQTRHWRDGYSLYTHSLNVANANFVVMHNLCVTLASLNRFAEAEPLCRKASVEEPRWTDPHIMLGVVQAKSGRPNEAVASFKRALEIDPSDPVALGNLATPKIMLGETDEAERTLNEAVAAYRERGQNPALLAASYAALAAASAQKKEYHRAAAALSQSVEFSPDRADYRANYALMLLLSGDKPGARSQIDLAIEQNPLQAENYNVLGMVHLAEEDRRGAVAAFEKALEIKPDLAEARSNLDKTKAAQSKIEEGAK